MVGAHQWDNPLTMNLERYSQQNNNWLVVQLVIYKTMEMLINYCRLLLWIIFRMLLRQARLIMLFKQLTNKYQTPIFLKISSSAINFLDVIKGLLLHIMRLRLQQAGQLSIWMVGVFFLRRHTLLLGRKLSTPLVEVLLCTIIVKARPLPALTFCLAF